MFKIVDKYPEMANFWEKGIIMEQELRELRKPGKRRCFKGVSDVERGFLGIVAKTVPVLFHKHGVVNRRVGLGIDDGNGRAVTGGFGEEDGGDQHAAGVED